jgi:hypothetical protein
MFPSEGETASYEVMKELAQIRANHESKLSVSSLQHDNDDHDGDDIHDTNESSLSSKSSILASRRLAPEPLQWKSNGPRTINTQMGRLTHHEWDTYAKRVLSLPSVTSLMEPSRDPNRALFSRPSTNTRSTTPSRPVNQLPLL